jgi:hypothetical protein
MYEQRKPPLEEIVKRLRFTVPLLRFIIPIDCLQAAKAANAKGRDETKLMQQFSNIPLQTLVRLTRIETPLVDLVPKKPKAPPTTPPSPAAETPRARSRQKTSRASKASSTRRRQRRNKK